jgi:hypothetical protein
VLGGTFSGRLLAFREEEYFAGYFGNPGNCRLGSGPWESSCEVVGKQKSGGGEAAGTQWLRRSGG